MISWKVDLVGVNLVPSCLCRCDFMGRIFNYISFFQLWQAGKRSTQKFINMYAHIDFLRPYFDIEPSQFKNRYVMYSPE